MGGLFAGLSTGLSALTSFDQALQVSQNNVTNSSTPGYVKQTADLQALPFALPAGLTGGVSAGDPLSARNEFLEQAVRLQAESQGSYSAQSQVLPSIESIFSISGSSGVVGGLNNLLQSFLAWSASPDSSAAQQDVLANAQDLAQSLQSAAASLSSATASLNGNIDSTVQQINTVSSQIADYNAQIRKGTTPDAGLDANLHNSLETLSGLAGITVRFESDGTATVLLGGQAPLVLGDQSFALKTGYFDSVAPVNPNATPDAHILDSNGQDITSMVSQGSLGGFLQVRNSILPSLQGDGQQVGALNQLAKQVADRVNSILESGTTSSGQAGTPLFSYDTTSDANVAATLTVDPGITPTGLAPVDPGPPPVSNGIALNLANLGTSTAAPDQIDGQSILDFYSAVAQQVGQQSAAASDGNDTATQALAQARALRSTVSGVSLDTEAVNLTELQRGYQAASKLISVVDTMIQSLIDMVP